MQSDLVKKLQDALVAQGYYVGTADGHYGDKTDAAVRYYQSCAGLGIDGIAGQHVLDYLGVVDANDTVHVQLPAADVVSGPGHYSMHVTGTAAEQGVRVVAWFRGANGDHRAEVTVNLTANQATQADIDIPSEVVATSGEYHVLVNVFNHAGTSLGEQTGVVHVHHEGAAAPAPH